MLVLFVQLDEQTASLIPTYVVFNVGFASRPEKDPACFVVAVLTAEVERRETAAVSQVKVGLALAQKIHRLAEPAPSALVQSRVPVLQKQRDIN